MIKRILTLAVVAFLFASCDDTITVQTVDNTVIPSSNVSFGKYIYPLFQAKCAFSGCHSGSDPAGNLDLTSWVNATADINIIRQGDTLTSRLVWAIKDTPGISLMPPTYTGLALTANQKHGIIIWIEEGAKDN
jgi:hypothetical protein